MNPVDQVKLICSWTLTWIRPNPGQGFASNEPDRDRCSALGYQWRRIRTGRTTAADVQDDGVNSVVLTLMGDILYEQLHESKYGHGRSTRAEGGAVVDRNTSDGVAGAEKRLTHQIWIWIVGTPCNGE